MLMAQHHKVYAVDIIPEKSETINHRKSPRVGHEGESERNHGHQVHSAGWIYSFCPGEVQLQEHHLQP